MMRGTRLALEALGRRFCCIGFKFCSKDATSGPP